jgi:hypothetical protein
MMMMMMMMMIPGHGFIHRQDEEGQDMQVGWKRAIRVAMSTVTLLAGY